uniref:DSBA-like thioredoxin domain-containing protein n=1 Tax=Acrobeloides nanus TaxID=290746 RepID=A0A914CYB6_9BILA
MDLEHNNSYWGMNLKWPSNFQDIIQSKGTLLAQRFLVALDNKEPEFVQKVAEELWMKIWSRDEPIGKVENIKEVCKKLKIPDFDTIITEINSEKVKNQLKQNTDEAYNLGAFGIPWIVVQKQGKEPFYLFGSDRLHILCNELECEYQGPLKNLKKN